MGCIKLMVDQAFWLVNFLILFVLSTKNTELFFIYKRLSEHDDVTIITRL